MLTRHVPTQPLKTELATQNIYMQVSPAQSISESDNFIFLLVIVLTIAVLMDRNKLRKGGD